MDRNNTNFPLQLEHFLHQVDWSKKYDFLKYYQNIARIYALEQTNTKGLLIYHTMGMGKSILAVAIAMDMISDKTKQRQPIILLTKSLQDNMKNAIRKYISMRLKTDPGFADEMGFNASSEETPNQENLPNIEEWISKTFSFVSLNASNMMAQMRNVSRVGSRKKKGKSRNESPFSVSQQITDDDILESSIEAILDIPSLENKLLIVDEAQNLFRMITNGSKNGIELYNMIMKTRDIKCMFFSGTPISANPFELAVCFNMLAGSEIMPTIYKDFVEFYMDESSKIKNKEYFQNRIMGLVSHVSDKTEFQLKPDAPSVKNHPVNTAEVNFPEVYPTKVVYVEMHEQQYAQYKLAREKEIEEESRTYTVPNMVALMKPKSAFTTTFKVKTRKLSNFYYRRKGARLDNLTREDLDVPKLNKCMEIINKHDGQLRLLYSQFVGDGGLAPMIKRLEAEGWERFVPLRSKETDGPRLKNKKGGSDRPQNLDEFMRQYYQLDVTGAAEDGEAEDGEAEKRQSQKKQISLGDILQDKRVKRFAVITGEVPIEEREIIIQKMTAKSNRYGTLVDDPAVDTSENIDLLLISSTGSLGLDLKGIRCVIIMEPYWVYTLLEQIMARAARNNSHDYLPEKEQNVQTYILLAVPFGFEQSSEEQKTTDVDIYEKSLLSHAGTQSFEQAIKEVSIECTILKDSNCRICAPSNKKLFSSDPRADLKEPNPCKPPRREEKLPHFVHENKKYYYKKNPNSLFGYDLFAIDDVGVYQKLAENSEEYQNAISNLHKESKDYF